MQTLTYVIGKDKRALVKDVRDFHIDFNDASIKNWVQARQYEDGMRQVFVNVINEDGSPYDLTGTNIWFEGLLPNEVNRVIDAKHGVLIDPQNGRFRFDMPKQAFAVAGSYVQAFFRIMRGGSSITTLEFDLEVLADKVISGLIPSDYITPFEEILDDMLKDSKVTKQQMIDMVADLKQSYETSISDLSSALKKLSADAGEIQDQINAQNIVTKKQFDDGLFQTRSDTASQIKSAFEVIGDGSPQGTYDNLGALNTAYPTGTKGIYLTKDDGHWHYFANNAWQDGGVYNDPNNTKLMHEQVNAFDNKIDNGTFVLDDFGTAHPHSQGTNLSISRSFMGKDWLHIHGDINQKWNGVDWLWPATDSFFQWWGAGNVEVEFDIQSDTYANIAVQLQCLDENGPFQIENIEDINFEKTQALHYKGTFRLKPIPANTKSFAFVVFQTDNDLQTDFSITNVRFRRVMPKISFDQEDVVSDKNLVTPNFFTDIETVRLFNYHYFNVIGKDQTSLYKGIQYHIPNMDWSYLATGLQHVQFEMQSTKGGKFFVISQYDSKDNGAIRTDTLHEFNLQTNSMTKIDFYTAFPNVTGAQALKLIVMADDVKDINFLIGKMHVRPVQDNGTIQSDNVINPLRAKAQFIDYGKPDTKFAYVKESGTTWLRVVDKTIQDWKGAQFRFDLSGSGWNQGSYLLDGIVKLKGEVNISMQYFDMNQNLNHQDVILTQKTDDYVHVSELYRFNVQANDAFAAVIVFSGGTSPADMYISGNFSLKPLFDKGFMKANQANNIPLLQITGDISNATHDVKAPISYLFVGNGLSKQGYANLKWQGDSSTFLPKKSYRLELYSDTELKNKEKVQFVPSQFADSKINLKANYLDWTGANNIVAPDFMAKLTSTLGTINSKTVAPQQLAAPHQGQVLGSPVWITVNGVDKGLYMLQTRKSDTLYNADSDNPKHFAVQGSKYTDATAFKTNSAVFDENVDYSIEVGAGTDEQKASFNKFMTFVNTASDDDFNTHIGEYVNLASVALQILQAYYFSNIDVLGKNTIWQTWDLKQYSAVNYDNDLLYGLDWQGNGLSNPDGITLKGIIDRSKLLQRLVKNDEFASLLEQMAQQSTSLLNVGNVVEEYNQILDSVGQANYERDNAIWNSPNYKTFGLNYITKTLARKQATLLQDFKASNLKSLG